MKNSLDSKLQLYSTPYRLYVPLEFVHEKELSSKNCRILIPTYLFLVSIKVKSDPLAWSGVIDA